MKHNPLTQMDPFPFLRSAIGILLISGWISSLAAKEFAIDWNEDVPGQTPRGGETYYISAGKQSDNALVVTETTDPVSPLSGKAAAVQVRNDLSSGDLGEQVRLWWRMLPDTTAPKGTVIFPFRISEGGFQVSLGQNEHPYSRGTPASMALVDRNSIFLNMKLMAGEPVLVNAKKYRNDGIDPLQPDTEYILRIHWDFTVETPGFQVFLNDEQLTPFDSAEQQSQFVPLVKPETAARGVDSFALSSLGARKSQYFLGAILCKPD